MTQNGHTPLLSAVLKGQEEIVKQLIAHPGIDVNAKSKEVCDLIKRVSIIVHALRKLHETKLPSD